MKRIFPVLLAVMIFCASLVLAVPARADIVNSDGMVTIEGWYRIREDAVVPFEHYSFTGVNGFFTLYLTPGDLVRINGDEPSYEPLLAMPLVTMLEISVGGSNFDIIGVSDVSLMGLALNEIVPIYPVWPVVGEYSPIEQIFSEWIYVFLEVDTSAYPGEAQALTSIFEQYYIESEPPVFYDQNGGNSPSDPSTDGVYLAIYDILADAFYGDGAELSGDQTLVLTVLATLAIVFMFAIPFLVVWMVIRMILAFFGDR